MAHRLLSKHQKFTDKPETVVVTLAKDGNEAAFTELVSRHSARVRNFLRRLCGRHDLADDLAQITFVQAWKKIAQLNSVEAFTTWLNRIAVNTWLEEQRRVSPRMSSDPGDLEQMSDQKPEPDRQISSIDLERALMQLQANERLCVVLSYGNGYTHEQIAELTTFPLGTVKSHVLRGSAKLKDILGSI